MVEVDEQQEWDEVLDRLRGLMGEHFHSWAFVVLSEDGSWISDYTNVVLGEMLFKKALEDFEDMGDFEWPDEDGDYEGEEWKED